jgi:hypothetical protein
MPQLITTTVQFLYLKSAFLQGTEQPLEVWTAHSFAVNAAYSIGLHTTRPNSALTPLENEVRMRTWYCLLRDDQYVNTSLERVLGTLSGIKDFEHCLGPTSTDGGRLTFTRHVYRRRRRLLSR